MKVLTRSTLVERVSTVAKDTAAVSEHVEGAAAETASSTETINRSAHALADMARRLKEVVSTFSW